MPTSNEERDDVTTMKENPGDGGLQWLGLNNMSRGYRLAVRTRRAASHETSQGSMRKMIGERLSMRGKYF